MIQIKEQEVSTKAEARKGRPPKAAIAAKKTGGKGSVGRPLGRPPGEASRLQEFKARLLGTTGEKIITTLIRKAMDDEDKDQFAALKFCAERILPMSAFDAVKNSSVPVVTINISSMADKPMFGKGDVIDV